jgi:hypothetical protein
MKKLAINIIVFCAVLYAMLWGLDSLYTGRFTTHPITKTAWIFNKEHQEYDFAVLGNSRVYNVIDVLAMEKYAHLKGINMGVNGSKPVENYLVLNHFLKTNKVKTVLLQLDYLVATPIASPLNPKLPFHQTMELMPFIHDDEIYEVTAQYTSPIKYLPWRYIPFVRYAEFNQRYSPFRFFKNADTLCDEAGYRAWPGKRKSPVLADSAKIEPLKDSSQVKLNLDWVKKIAQTCKSHNIRLVIFSSPVHKVEYLYPVVPYAFDRIREFCYQNDIPYCDLSKRFINYPDSVFRDSFHTNGLVADELAKTIVDSIWGLQGK